MFDLGTGALVIGEFSIPNWLAAAVVTGVCLCGCAPKRGEEASPPHSRTAQGEGAGGPAGGVGDAGKVGAVGKFGAVGRVDAVGMVDAVEKGDEIGKAPPVAEICVPENKGALGIRVAGKPLIPERVLHTYDRADWPDYAPPEMIRVTLPEVPSELAPPARPITEGRNTAQSEGEDDGDRSPDGH